MAGAPPPNPNPNPHQPPPPAKRKRNLPGTPDPDAEVIALSPATLLSAATFVCDVCGKEFRRDQNLQIHRRGHNIPWKHAARPKEAAARKRVYVCPAEGCVYHDPARALGDLTGIKKHYCRKHGEEKRWQCERCLKKYAVRTDWKAHARVCGRREFECCGCGTLFERCSINCLSYYLFLARVRSRDGVGLMVITVITPQSFIVITLIRTNNFFYIALTITLILVVTPNVCFRQSSWSTL